MVVIPCLGGTGYADLDPMLSHTPSKESWALSWSPCSCTCLARKAGGASSLVGTCHLLCLLVCAADLRDDHSLPIWAKLPACTGEKLVMAMILHGQC